MYPYGKSYGTNASYTATTDYRYGFNGMEKAWEIGTDLSDFGARVFDAEFPVFLSRDPLEGNAPEQSAYLFGSNNPVWAIDYNGETSFFVMGTGYSLKDNQNKQLQNTVNYIHSAMSTSTGKVNYGFDWSDLNGLLNGPYQWGVAAERLAEYALKNNKDGDDITFIGYSYGGAVSIIAADKIYEKTNGKIKVNIITIVTPANNYERTFEYDKYKNEISNYARFLYENEMFKILGNPKYSKGINDMTHFYLEEDGVAGGLRYDDYYNSWKVDNYLLLSANAPWHDSFGDFIDRFAYSHKQIIYLMNIFKETIESNGISRQTSTGSNSQGSKTPSATDSDER